MASAEDIAKELDAQVESLGRGLPALEREAFDNIRILLKDLTLLSNGTIKPTIANLKIINKVRSALENIVGDKRYKKIIGRVQDSIDEIGSLNTAYFSKTFADFTVPAAVKQLKTISLQTTKENLVGAGMQENVVNAAVDIVDKGIRGGSSFATLQNNLEEFMVGNAKVPGKLTSYSQQIISDTLSGYTATYHKMVAADLGLQWYQYVGATMKTTRPWCKAMVDKQWVHESELPSVARGNIDGKQISIAGLFPNTNGHTVIDFRGGYNCRHLFVPVPEQAVPTAIKRKFQKDVPPDPAEVN
jgi:hypothetical protein